MKEGEDHQDDAEYSQGTSFRRPGMLISGVIAALVVVIGFYYLAG
jgi:hypothetical protein